MRVTANELRNVISRLPAVSKAGPSLINIAIQSHTPSIRGSGKSYNRSDLRVVTFRKMQPANKRVAPEWELELV